LLCLPIRKTREGAMDKFFFYESYFDIMVSLPEEDGLEFLKAVVTYGIKETYDIHSPIAEAVFVNIREQISYNQIRSAQRSWVGKKGGRPREVNREEAIKFKNQGYTVKEIAQIMQCSERTVQRAIKPRLTSLTEEKEINARKTNYRAIRSDIARELRAKNESKNESNAVTIEGVGTFNNFGEYIGKPKELGDIYVEFFGKTKEELEREEMEDI
jgi:AraC-like DNA-binding protein